MYTLYIANKNYSSWSLRPWVLMRELGIPFDERQVPFTDDWTPDAFRSFSPTAKVPCLHDQGNVIWDSFAITEYLAERHEGIWPGDPQIRTVARCASAEMHSGFFALRSECPMSCGVRVRLSHMSDELQRDVGRINELWSECLAQFGGPFLAGSRFTAVDAFYAPVAFRAQTYKLPFDQAAADYVARILDLSSMRDWYTAALAETWREASHEAEISQTGDVLEDLRATVRA